MSAPEPEQAPVAADSDVTSDGQLDGAHSAAVPVGGEPTITEEPWTTLIASSVSDALKPSRWLPGVLHPIAALRRAVGDGPLYALLILFGLNAADELDRTAFGILLPNIRDDLGMSNGSILSLVAVTMLGALLMQLPIAIWADRGNRVRLALMGAAAWGVFSLMTGFSTTVWMLIIARSGAGIGRAVVEPTHGSLLADYFAVDRRASVFSIHRAGNVVGQFAGPLLAGVLAHATGNWHVPFLVFAVPTVLLVIAGFRLVEPKRGAQERAAAGGSAELADLEEPPASFAEAYRLVSQVASLRRLWYSMPFLAVSFIGFVSLSGLMYEDTFHLDELGRGYLAAGVEPFQLIGLAIGAAVGTKLFLRDPSLVFKFLRASGVAAGVFAVCFALAPTLWLAIVFHILLTACLAVLLPGILASLSIAIPARARSVGFAMASYWVIPGLVILPLIGWISDTFGVRAGMAMMAPVLVIGALVISSVGSTINRDIADAWGGSLSRAEALRSRRAGESKLLIVNGLHVSYGTLRVLEGIDIAVGEGEVVALLGTNGAGKSTLLNAISGTVEASYGAVILDGRDITHAPPYEIAHLGVSVMPGGAAVFGAMTVDENLDVAGHTSRTDRSACAARRAEMMRLFPILAERSNEPAANLSGGQQQQLGLAMALIAAPRLLLIDELSLGLAPLVVEQLADVVRQVAASGTTIILVEQSVNIALTLADRAYFMEKGVVRFEGPTAELLERPDLLRSVFLAEAELAGDAAGHGSNTAGAPEPVAGTSDDFKPSGSTGAPGGTAVDSAAAAATAVRSPSVQPAIEARRVSVSFGGIQAVSDVSLAVAPGEIVGLIGANGAGKTTLLDLLSGSTRPTSGAVKMAGVDVSGLAPHQRARRGLGRSFQDARLFPSMTVAETVLVALERSLAVTDPVSAMLRTPPQVRSEFDARLRVDELLDQMGLSDYRDKFISELSTGSRRVVDLTCVVAAEPDVVLLDEPAAGIAQRESEALAPLIRSIRDRLGCAIVIVEHDIPLVRSVADRLVAMETGAVIAQGDPHEVLSHPDVIASYLGNSPDIIERSGATT